MTHRGPYTPEKFQAQNPDISGCSRGWFLCTAFGMAMGANQGSRWSVDLTGCEIWKSTGDNSGGLRLSQCVPIIQKHGVHVDVYTGDISTYGLAVNLQAGRGANVQGNTKPLLSTSHRSTAGAINHNVHIATVRGGTLGHPTEAYVWDPAADGHTGGWGTAAKGPQWWPWSLVLSFAAALRPWGDGDPRTLGPNRAYCALFPDTEPHYHSKFGGNPTTRMPDIIKGKAGASLVARRVRPGPGLQYKPLWVLQVGQNFAAYQWTNGPIVNGRERWYGSHDGDNWISAAGITGEGGTQ